MMLLFGSLVFICSCSQTALQENFLAYQQQLTNELDFAIELSSENIHLTYPAAKVLKLELSETTINLRELFALQDCYVATLIAQRNTALGKVQLPSVRFAYEVKLIGGLQECLQNVDIEQQQLISQWLQQKQNNLPLVWADMLQNSQEIKRTFSGNTQLFNHVSDEKLQVYQQHLDYFIQLNSSDVINVSSKLGDLEANLNALRKMPLSSQLWRTQNQIEIWLTNINTQLNTVFNELECNTEQSRQQINRLKAIYQLHFINGIKPITEDVNDAIEHLMPSFKTLQETHVLANAFRHFLLQRETEHLNYKKAVKRHDFLWQTLFKKCELNSP